MLFRPNKEYKEWNDLNYMGGGREGQMLGKENTALGNKRNADVSKSRM